LNRDLRVLDAIVSDPLVRASLLPYIDIFLSFPFQAFLCHLLPTTTFVKYLVFLLQSQTSSSCMLLLFVFVVRVRLVSGVSTSIRLCSQSQTSSSCIWCFFFRVCYYSSCNNRRFYFYLCVAVDGWTGGSICQTEPISAEFCNPLNSNSVVFVFVVRVRLVLPVSGVSSSECYYSSCNNRRFYFYLCVAVDGWTGGSICQTEPLVQNFVSHSVSNSVLFFFVVRVRLVLHVSDVSSSEHAKPDEVFH
jgi:hypothetical protein